MARKQTTITIATGKGPRQIEAYTFPSLPGLAIHRDVKSVSQDGPVVLYTNGWTVTHIQSGLEVCNGLYMSRLVGAQAWARALCQFADWTHNKGQVREQIRGKMHTMLSCAKSAAEATGEVF